MALFNLGSFMFGKRRRNDRAYRVLRYIYRLWVGIGEVGGQLELHKRLIAQVKQGWRPITPQHRGGQAPCKEPPVEVELFKKAMPHYTWKIIHFYSNEAQVSNISDAVSDQVAIDSSSESGESSDSSSDGSWSEVEETTPDFNGAIAMGHHRNTVHAMIKNDKPIKNGATFLETPVKTGCGLIFTHDRISFLDLTAPLDGKTACNHRGCNRLISSKKEKIQGRCSQED